MDFSRPVCAGSGGSQRDRSEQTKHHGESAMGNGLGLGLGGGRSVVPWDGFRHPIVAAEHFKTNRRGQFYPFGSIDA